MKDKATHIIAFCALLYALVCLGIALFLPPTFQTILDNVLFPIGLIHLTIVFKNNRRYRLLMGLFFLIFTWMIIAELIAKRTISFSSLNYIIYFLKWPVIIFSLIDNPFIPRTKEKIFRLIDGIFLVLTAINIFILLNPFDLGESLQLLYSPKIETNFVYFNEIGTFRLTGTCMDPNNNGAIFGSFFLFYLFMKKKEAWTYLLMAAFIILMTQSRTIFLGIAIIYFVRIIYFLFQNNNFKKYLVLILTGCIFLTGIILFSTNLRSLFDGDAFLSNSFITRIGNLLHFTDSNNLNQFVGSGVILNPYDKFGFYFDSELIAMLFQFGIGGLILWFTLLMYVIFYFKIHASRSQFITAYAVFIIIVSTTNFTFLNSQFGIVLSSFVGIGLLLEEKYWITIPRKNPVKQA